MPNEFHCPKCGRLIRAPASAGGKRGKCPYCKQSVYIPSLSEDVEAIPLAPVDEASEDRERALEDEARRFATAISQEEPGKYDTGEPPPPSGESAMPLPRDFDVDVPELVNDYLSAMAASDMGRADTAARQLRKQAAQAKAHVERLIADKLPPPDLGSVPAPVYKGFLRSLLELL